MNMFDQQAVFLNLIQTRNPILLAEAVSAAGKLNSKEALNVYIQDYWLRLAGALADLFPSVADASGQDFIDLCCEYLSKNPSQHYNLDQIGEALPEFILNHQLFQKYPYLSELANLEKAYLKCFHATDSPEPNWSLLDTHPPEKLHLEFNQVIYRFESKFPLLSLWRQSQQDSKGPQKPDFDQPTCFLLYPFKQSVRYLQLSPVANRLFQIFQIESNITQALADLSELTSELEPTEISQFFYSLRQERLIAKIWTK